MDNTRVTISIDSGLMRQIDGLVRERMFSDRGHAIRNAVREGVTSLDQKIVNNNRTRKRTSPEREDEAVFEKRKWPEF